MTALNIIPSLNSPSLPYTLVSLSSTNATVVKATPGFVTGFSVFNINAAVRYIKFYNKATAPTVGTDTPVMVFGIPAGSGNNYVLPCSVSFSSGISFALTTGITNADTGAVAASEILVNIFYK